MIVDAAYVRAKLAGIAAAAERGEDAVAHQREDLLLHALLTAMAEGRCPDPVGCAQLAVQALDVPFVRWYGEMPVTLTAPP